VEVDVNPLFVNRAGALAADALVVRADANDHGDGKGKRT